MRFPLAAMFFIIASFIFFVIWAVCSYMLGWAADALMPFAPAQADTTIMLLRDSFGVIAALFFIIGIILVFILDATADEPESYYREGY